MRWAIRLSLSAVVLLIVLLAGLLIPVPLSASEPVTKDVRCMAEAVYYEARDQSTMGQLAVAIVIRNRMNDERWPSTACGVVKDGRYWNGHPVKHQCQFSYWCDGKPERPAEKEAWQRALNIAHLAYYRSIEIEGLIDATHYHAVWVSPSWSRKLRLAAQIGDHRFYSTN